MSRLRILAVLVLTSCLVFSTIQPVLAVKVDIGSAGLPTMTGNVGGSVIGSGLLTDNLVVTVDFGELSPANSNQIVKVVIPIALRSDNAYKVTVTLTGSVGVDPDAVRFSDIGFGVQNLRSFGNTPTACGVNSTFNALFNNDPSSTFTINGATGRAQYTSSLANFAVPTVIINGPQLSQTFKASGRNDGWAFDAILAVKPQYYTPGVFSGITLTFVISAGPAFPCV
jgi:hypothetical protein